MSRAKQVLGKDLMLFVGGKAIALATSCKIGISAETIDTQSKDSGIWNEKDIKKLGWNCSSENCFSADLDINGYDALFAMMVAAQPIDVAFGIPVNKSTEMPESGWRLPVSPYKGKALITSLELNAPDGDKATFSVSMDGTGALIPGDMAATPPPIVIGTSVDDPSYKGSFEQSDVVGMGMECSITGTNAVDFSVEGGFSGITGIEFYLKGAKLDLAANDITIHFSLKNGIVNFSPDSNIDFDCIKLIGGNYLIPIAKYGF